MTGRNRFSEWRRLFLAWASGNLLWAFGSTAVAAILSILLAQIAGLEEPWSYLFFAATTVLGATLLLALVRWLLQRFGTSLEPAGSTLGDQLEPAVDSPSWHELNRERESRYQANRGLFLIHTWTRSGKPGQVADVVISLFQHGAGPLSSGQIRAVEYTLGPRFTNHSIVSTDATTGFSIEVSMWGPMLCLAKVFFMDGSLPLVLERYINFDKDEETAPLSP